MDRPRPEDPTLTRSPGSGEPVFNQMTEDTSDTIPSGKAPLPAVSADRPSIDG